ncbi:hypothetical protein [Mycolicibacterium sp.]|uniref:hypothetical protein n=1 Tax=Mycolicibacterium sp. TaxID=2320850 RepID=UPI00355CB7E1
MGVFYELPASAVVAGVSTDDAQDVLAVELTGGDAHLTVYTPRPDDPDADADNMASPETRVHRVDAWVALAVFEDTRVDLSRDSRARNRREVADR